MTVADLVVTYADETLGAHNTNGFNPAGLPLPNLVIYLKVSRFRLLIMLIAHKSSLSTYCLSWWLTS
jgi:hypothetical protein